MSITRRDAAKVIGAATLVVAGCQTLQGEQQMHGLIGKLIAAPGQRDALMRILMEGSGDMPGCLSYIVAKDPTDENGIWITEVWDDAASHKASLQLPQVKDAISRGKPLIAGAGVHFVTEPVGGHGLTTSG